MKKSITGVIIVAIAAGIGWYVYQNNASKSARREIVENVENVGVVKPVESPDGRKRCAEETVVKLTHPATRNPQPATRIPHPASRIPYPASSTPYPASSTPYPAPRIPHPATRIPQPDSP